MNLIAEPSKKIDFAAKVVHHFPFSFSKNDRIQYSKLRFDSDAVS